MTSIDTLVLIRLNGGKEQFAFDQMCRSRYVRPNTSNPFQMNWQKSTGSWSGNIISTF